MPLIQLNKVVLQATLGPIKPVIAPSVTFRLISLLAMTPPNALLIAYLADNYGIEISFARWMMVGIPVTFVMLPIAWIVLTRFIFKVDIPASGAVHNHLHKLRDEMGPMSTPEKRVAVVFGAAGAPDALACVVAARDAATTIARTRAPRRAAAARERCTSRR